VVGRRGWVKEEKNNFLAPMNLKKEEKKGFIDFVTIQRSQNI
jgi:hypothetical protein